MRGLTARWRRSPQASWRAVPEMNLLAAGGLRRRWAVRAGLALLLLGGVNLLFSMYQGGTTQQRELDGASSRLKATQGELTSRRDEVNRLEAELAALRQRRQNAERLPQQLGSERWRAALAALEGLQSEGVRFQT